MYEILVTSPPDRECLVAEIWDRDQMVAEINQENKDFEVTIYPLEQGVVLMLDEFIKALSAGKERLAT